MDNMRMYASEDVDLKIRAVDLRDMQYYQSLLYTTKNELEKKRNDLEMMLIDKEKVVYAEDVKKAGEVYKNFVTILDWLVYNKDYSKLAGQVDKLRQERELLNSNAGGDSNYAQALTSAVMMGENFLEKVEKYVSFCDVVFAVERKK